MRIIAGKWRSVRLVPPTGRQTRPILDHAKEAVFNILGAMLAAPGELPWCRVLDLFAGTGSLGLEALSRGAAFCTFVERGRTTAAELGKNITRLHAEDQAEVQVADIWRMRFEGIPASGLYDLVFLDPPYNDARSFKPRDRVPTLLAKIAAGASVHPDAIIVLRHPKSAPCDECTFPNHRLIDQRTYGDMTISFLKQSLAAES